MYQAIYGGVVVAIALLLWGKPAQAQPQTLPDPATLPGTIA
jgi:hypothetical protein